MFDNQRYLTRGVQAEIPLELQLFMWDCDEDNSLYIVKGSNPMFLIHFEALGLYA